MKQRMIIAGFMVQTLIVIFLLLSNGRKQNKIDQLKQQSGFNENLINTLKNQNKVEIDHLRLSQKKIDSLATKISIVDQNLKKFADQKKRSQQKFDQAKNDLPNKSIDSLKIIALEP